MLCLKYQGISWSNDNDWPQFSHLDLNFGNKAGISAIPVNLIRRSVGKMINAILNISNVLNKINWIFLICNPFNKQYLSHIYTSFECHKLTSVSVMSRSNINCKSKTPALCWIQQPAHRYVQRIDKSCILLSSSTALAW